MDILKFIIGGLFVLIILAFYVSVPIRIKRYLMKQTLLKQQKLIPGQTQFAKQITDIEDWISSLIFLPCGALFFGLFIINYVRENDFIRENPWSSLWGIFVFVTFIFYALDIFVFYLRRAAGAIQGAVLFDSQKKIIYAFPSLASDRYDTYHASDLVYTTESVSMGRTQGKTVYVFFTKAENEFAFKVRDLEYNNFDAILSQWEPIDISIPFKHRFHTIIIPLVGLAFFIFCAMIIGSIIMRSMP